MFEREIIMKAQDVRRTRTITSIVPQFSVLGPTQWNVRYTDLIEMQQPQG